MKKAAYIPTTVDEYIATFPASTQKMLKQLRAIIKKHAPQAEEYIGYQMPAYKLEGALVYFAGYHKHIGFYPTGRGLLQFKEEISAFKNSKGTVQFPLDKALPVALITKIVKFRVQENLEKAALKPSRKKEVDFLSLLSSPARNALVNAGIKTLKKVATYSETEILKIHGVGPKTIPTLRAALKEARLKFKS